MNNFLICVFALLCATAYAGTRIPLTSEERTMLKSKLEECQSDPNTKIPREISENLQHGKWPEDEQLFAGLLCFAIKTDMMSENGDLNIPHIKEAWGRHYPDDIKNLEACMVQKENPKRTAYHLLKCKQNVVGVSNDALNVLNSH
ncbi:unnamed protein product [Brassicogethes aeneus]|uniref:Uncharacterized protein n=1 Tax=Brassicogethes aeneus TaxID=1431903 RepID=A0A9P0AV61_BRAAE|nr:unnamed protein product [Brassicogethes aeneus]